MFSSKVVVPSDGSAIVIDDNGKLIVPDNPIVPFIRGDGIGADITPVMKKVVDAAVAKAYQGKKSKKWNLMHVFPMKSYKASTWC